LGRKRTSPIPRSFVNPDGPRDSRSVCETYLAQESAPPGIGAQAAEQGFDFHLAEPRVPLHVRPLQPREREVRLAARGVNLCDLS
jgi:hypothetical protein